MRTPPNRKAQISAINNVGMIAITLVVVVIIIAMGSNILQEMEDVADDNTAAMTTNESLTWPGNNTAVSVVQSRMIDGTETIWNATTLLVVNTHYITNGSLIYFTNDTVDGWGDFVTTGLNISYSYLYGSTARNVTGEGITGQVKLMQFVPTIAIVAIAAILIGIILAVFARPKPK